MAVGVSDLAGLMVCSMPVGAFITMAVGVPWSASWFIACPWVPSSPWTPTYVSSE